MPVFRKQRPPGFILKRRPYPTTGSGIFSRNSAKTVRVAETLSYRSSGKIILTGEYLVLYGADSFAVPTIPGQVLRIEDGGPAHELAWDTRIRGRDWFRLKLDTDRFEIIDTNAHGIATQLIRLLRAAVSINGSTSWLQGKHAKAEIEFDMGWGLGSSSSLISNIAYWAEIAPFDLYRAVSSGSGCDIAASRTDGPLIYNLREGIPTSRKVVYKPEYLDKLGFAWLGRKQDSACSVKSFLDKAMVRQADIDRISELGSAFPGAANLEALGQVIHEHEMILGGILERTPVRQALFPDYTGAVKSLGAWGGDLVLFTAPSGWEEAAGYFKRKGLELIFRFTELVQNKEHR